MTQRDWQRDDAHALGVFLNGEEIADRTPHGEPIVDDSFLLLFNAHHEDVTFTLPARRFGAAWAHELCTARPDGSQPGADRGCALATSSRSPAAPRSLRLLRRVVT